MAGPGRLTRWVGLRALVGQLFLLAVPARALPGPVDPLLALGPAICTADGAVPVTPPHGAPHDCPVCFFCIATCGSIAALLPSPPVLPAPSRIARRTAAWAPAATWQDRTPEHCAARDPPTLLAV